MALEQRTAEQLDRQRLAQAALNRFASAIPSLVAQSQSGDCSGDHKVLEHLSKLSGKRGTFEQAAWLERSYLYRYLRYVGRCEEGGGEGREALEAFMRAKIESERFVQWAGMLPPRLCLPPVSALAWHRWRLKLVASPSALMPAWRCKR